MANRLADATSPYLQQHKDNPVDWWQWSDGAFAAARERDVPVLISVGYAACHWCHVMAHESFENEAVAAIVNDLVVPIKVDREERPDVDAVYMTATQAMTGQGGWPMTVFATPTGEPFYCGTYFPPDAFLRLVHAVADAWANQRDAVVRQGNAVVEAIGRTAARVPQNAMTQGVLDAAAHSLLQDFDPGDGGFGGAPKFPPHMGLLFLLRWYERTRDERALEAVRVTSERMARGGLYDQLAGGFARYSVDATWTVPHFEKMLYDNALLLRSYTQLARITGDALARRVADETAAFLDGELFDGHGFISALDADADGVEGLTYVWTPAELTELLGELEGPWAASLLRVTEPGTFEHGASVLQLPEDPADVARWSQVRRKLEEARAKRPQPARDGKVVAAWNGLAVTALVEHGMIFGAGASTRRAIAVASFLAETHVVDGRLRRVSRDGVVGAPAGVLEDYGCVAEAYCAVHQVTGDGRWLDAGPRAARRGVGALRGRDRRLLRHRRRRRATGQPAGRHHRQRDALRGLVDRGGADGVRGAERRDAVPGGGRGGPRHGGAGGADARAVHRVRVCDRRGDRVRPPRSGDRDVDAGRSAARCRLEARAGRQRDRRRRAGPAGGAAP